MVSNAADLDNCLTPSSGKEILKFASDLPAHMHSYHRVSNENSRAGKYFCYNFMNRYFRLRL